MIESLASASCGADVSSCVAYAESFDTVGVSLGGTRTSENSYTYAFVPTRIDLGTPGARAGEPSAAGRGVGCAGFVATAARVAVRTAAAICMLLPRNKQTALRLQILALSPRKDVPICYQWHFNSNCSIRGLPRKNTELPE